MTLLPLDRSALLTFKNPEYAHSIRDFFTWQLAQDGNDITTELLLPEAKDRSSKAVLIAKNPGVLAGSTEVEWFFSQAQEASERLEFTWKCEQGKAFDSGTHIAELKGTLANILHYERTILNTLSRLSGIATVTKKLSFALPQNVFLAATRKTLWGLLDKKAVASGGGLTHRLGLFDAVLAKDNHLSTVPEGAKSIAENIAISLRSAPEKLGAFWEIEVENANDLDIVLSVFENVPTPVPGVIMLDNFAPENIAQALQKIPLSFWNERHIFFEASGGITPENIASFAKSGVNILSAGFLTHTPHPVDISLEIVTKN